MGTVGAGDRSRGRAVRDFGRREIHPDLVRSWILRHKVALILALGVIARVAQFLADRHFWMDEESLATNIVTKRFTELFGPLVNAQLAPPGFLAVEWGVYHLLPWGGQSLVLRLFPLLCGVGSLFLFVRVARRCLRPDAVWVALALFAVSDDLIYYASELKQYSTDVAMALLCNLFALDLLTRPASPFRLIRFAAVGAAVVWFSHPAAFVLAGLGGVLIVSAVVGREWKRALAFACMSLVWVASFVCVYLVALEQLDHRGTMWAFWEFAFPPRPLTFLGGAGWLFHTGLYLFANPLELDTPLGPRISALVALGLFLAGSASLVRRGEGRLFWMLVAPGLFALMASCLHLYPFHGRLLLFLVPSLLLLVAEGVAWIGEAAGSPAFRVVLIAGLLVLPTLRVAYHLVDPRQRTEFNPRGDRRPEKLEPTHFPF